MNNIKLKVNRYEPYGDPVEYLIVGFLVENTDTSKKEYVESLLDIKATVDKSEAEICQLAYDQVKNKIKLISDRISKKSNILGYEFIPSI